MSPNTNDERKCDALNAIPEPLVSRGRIRLNEIQAQAASTALYIQQRASLDQMGAAREAGDDELARSLQRQARLIEQVRGKVAELIEEKGWTPVAGPH